MTLSVKRLRESAVLPVQATAQSAGWDLSACLVTPLLIPAGETRVVATGIAIEPPEGSVALVFGRSGLGIKAGLAPANGVGVIDADYRGEILVGLHNHSKADYHVAPTERIAQLVLLPVVSVNLVEVQQLAASQRGEGGLGSTGKI